MMACHTDQARSFMRESFTAQCEALSGIAYQANTAIVHTDRRLLPDRPRAWGAWNYLWLAPYRERGKAQRVA